LDKDLFVVFESEGTVSETMFAVSRAWQAAYPGAAVGVLALRDVSNPEHHAALDTRKAALEEDLRARWAGQDRKALLALPTIAPYSAYYARFRKTYHVLLQLESVALKGRSLPSVAALVEAMFMAELKNQLLTAGHDLAALALPAAVDVATGRESYLTLSGKEQLLAAGDMYIHDAQGVMSSIIYGPDRRTAISPASRRVMFTVYAPPGITVAMVRAHLDDLRDNVLVVAPEATLEMSQVFGAE
jgi:DNA/RNA-binding domain of Phe-tRNA-synthetase-like protein